MTSISAGEYVLDSSSSASRVIAVQHKSIELLGELHAIHTSDGNTLSMTADHAIFANGELVAASDLSVGDLLTNVAERHERVVVERTSKHKGAVINVVTASGTIVANGLLAGSNPLTTAKHIINQPIKRAIVNAALYVAGDVDSFMLGACKVFLTVLTVLTIAISLKQLAHKRIHEIKSN